MIDTVERRIQPIASPFGIVVAVLLSLLIGAASWGVSHRTEASYATVPSTVAAGTALSPDAEDRNAQILAARLGKAEANHGH